jgi:isopentenyl diphosphate isomerase/L-lactate dehydrogenase-like FMN-dependent dehydrogenase
MTNIQARRTFLRYLAASPLFASATFSPLRGLLSAAETHVADWEMGQVVEAAKDAINVFDFHAVAREKLPPAHYGYVQTGTDHEETLRANREGFKKFQLRVRRLIDVREVDMSVELMGQRWVSPIGLCPTGTQKVFHPEGEVAVARAAKETGSLQMLSTVTTTSIEEVNRELGRPVWFQLYASQDWNVTSAMLKRAEKAGCPVVALTVDLQGGSNRETAERYARRDNRDCTVCHDRRLPQRYQHRPMLEGLDLSNLGNLLAPQMTWDFARRVRDATSMKLFIKGIVDAEDAALCVENGVSGIIVSNHGGRAEASGRSTIECLPEITKAVNGRIPVLIDGGFRRGTDVFKALALGAGHVCIGRPYLWALAAFGQEGVRTVIELFRAELQMVMRQAGTTSTDQISEKNIIHAG